MSEATPSRLSSFCCNANVLYFLGALSVMEAAALLYGVSLRGGSVGYIKENMAMLGVAMVLATLLVLAITVLTVFALSKVRIPVKLAAMAAGWALFLRTVFSDTDTTLLNHGHYNFAVFLLVFSAGFTLSVLVVGALKLVKTVSPVLCWGSSMMIIAVCWSFWMFSSTEAYRGWTKGMEARLELEWPQCSLDFHSIPWLSVIPTRTFNFFLGTNDCPQVDEFASLSRDGTLRLHCEEEVTIVENPDFMSKRKSWWILDECGLTTWKDKLKDKQTKYKFPGNGKTQIKSEYFQVFCGNEENYFVQNVKNQTLVDQLAALPPADRMNLIVFQIDNLSRAHFIRTMKQTARTLQSLAASNEIELVEMLRVVTVGFNTEFNTKAMYTGSQFRQDRGGRPYWDIFKSQGSVALYLNGNRQTGFCEDWANRFLKRDQSGVDYFTFLPWCHPDYHPYEHTFSLLTGVNALQRRCLKGDKVHQRIFRYLFNFWDNYPEFGKVVHIPLQEAHEASGAVVTTLDPDFSDFLTEMHSRGELNKTIIVIASDHGNHMTPYYPMSEVLSTQAGALEQLMPGVTYVVPKQFAEKYPDFMKTLKDNQQRLTVHYDTYWTIRHLSTLPEYGGGLSVPMESEAEKFTSLWDCEANANYMKDIWFFRDKKFENILGWKWYDTLTDLVLGKLKQCVLTYADPSPAEDPMKHEITITTSSGDEVVKGITLEKMPNRGAQGPYYLTVQNLIKDYNAVYWFEDAISDLQYFSMTHPHDQVVMYINQVGDHQRETEQERETREVNKAAGHGRYVYGWSLLQYAKDRTCNTTGIVECPCRP